MKNLKKETAKMLSSATDGLVKVVGSTSFEMWKRKDFRLYIDFDNITQEEQDRIFNELQVSVLGLFILHLEEALLDTTDLKKQVISAVHKDLIPAFLSLYNDLKIEKRFVDQWEELINLRLIEYKNDLKIAIKESMKMQELKDEKHLRNVWARIQTVTINSLTHIRRGKVEEKDPLWGLLRKWFISLDIKLNPITSTTKL